MQAGEVFSSVYLPKNNSMALVAGRGGVQSVISLHVGSRADPNEKRMVMHFRRLVSRSWATET